MAVKKELKRSIDPIWHALQSTAMAEPSGAIQRLLIRGSTAVLRGPHFVNTDSDYVEIINSSNQAEDARSKTLILFLLLKERICSFILNTVSALPSQVLQVTKLLFFHNPLQTHQTVHSMSW